MFSLRSKLILGFCALLAVAVIIGAIGLGVVSSYSQALTKILRENYDSMVYCEGMKDALDDFNNEMQKAVLLRQTVDLQRIEQAKHRFQDYLGLERGNITLVGEADSVRKIERLWSQMDSAIAIPFYDGQADTSCAGMYFGFILPLHEKISLTVKNISAMNLSNMIAVDGQAQRRAQEAKQITYVLILVGILLALVLIIVTGRSILQPLKTLTQSIRELQTGNLNLVLQPRFRDEVGLLMEAFNDMSAELRALKQGDQARLARSQQSAQLVLDSLPDAVIVMAPDATVELANASARKLMGVVPGGSIYDTSPEWHNSLKRDAQAESESDEHRDRVVQVFVEGQEKFFLPRILPIRDVNRLPVGLIVVLVDVTRMKRMTELESDLISTVSHELKTPLTSVRMAMHMLMDERVGPINEKQAELLSAARDDAERLFSIVNNLLDVARYKSGKTVLELQPVPAYKTLDKAAAAARSSYHHAGVELTLDAPDDLPDVLVNEARITYVFDNLLSNALKHSSPGAVVVMTARVTDKYLEVAVSDQGPGIPKEDLPRVFDRFYRGKHEGAVQGVGLGLAIAREIVEAHGGTISVSSVLDHGATFTFSLRKVKAS